MQNRDPCGSVDLGPRKMVDNVEPRSGFARDYRR
jgi:hypothetical protein